MEGGIIGLERSVDLVGRDVEEVEGFAVGGCHGLVKVARGLQQDEGDFDVGAQEDVGADDGAVNAAFSSEVEDGAELVLREDAGDQGGVNGVALDEGVVRGAGDGGDVFRIVGLGELVHVHQQRDPS